MIRKDYGDLVYLTMIEKYNAIIEDVRECQKINQFLLELHLLNHQNFCLKH